MTPVTSWLCAWPAIGDADDPAVVDHVGADEPLAVEDRLAAMEPERLGDQHEPVAGPDLATEPHVLHAAKGDEIPRCGAGSGGKEARELRGRLADQDARHQRIVGHVAADPELVVAATSL